MNLKNIYNDKNQIYVNTVSAPCGSGKTYALGQYIKNNLDQCNHLILLPSLILLNQIKNDLQNIHGIASVSTITSESETCVRKAAIEFFKNCLSSSHVLLMTWQGFQDIAYFHDKSNWQIYIDEIPNIDRFYPFMVPFNKKYIFDFVEIDEPVNGDLALVKIKDGYRAKLKQLILKPRDQVNELFQEFYRDLLSDNKDVFVDLQSWNRVFEKSHVSSSQERNKVFFLSMLNPKDWHGVTLLGANIERSMIYHWFSTYHQVIFVEHDITDHLRYREHTEDHGNRLNISYFLKDQHFSKYYRDHTIREDHDVAKIMDKQALKAFKDQEFLYVCNNDYHSELLENSANAKKIPVISHGLNEYQNFTRIYFLMALNREPQHIGMLLTLEFDSIQILTATAHEVIYQCLMRTALRNPESPEPVHVIVPDEYSANRLVEIFGCANKRRIGDLEYKKYQLSSGDRNRRSRFFKLKDDIFSDASKSLHFSIYIENSNENDAHGKGKVKAIPYAVTFHKDVMNKEPSEFVIEQYKPLELVQLLKQMSVTKIVKKEEFFMINAALFDPTIDTEGVRRQANFQQSCMMILDFDDGDLSPEKFESIFWHDAKPSDRRSFVICNSFSRSAEKPNKFRVFMFYKRPVQSIEEHQAVFDDIVRRLERNGFTQKSSELDPACRSGNQSFYIPCTNREHPEYAFFRKYGCKRTADLFRYAIDPKSCTPKVSKPIIIERPTIEPVSEIGTINDQLVQIKNKIKNMSSGRHRPFFKAAVDMAKQGLSINEIELHCNDIAGTDQKMKRKVEGIITTLQKPSYRHLFS